MRKFVLFPLVIGLLALIPAALAATSTLQITGTPSITSCNLNQTKWTGTLFSWSIEAGYHVAGDEIIDGATFNKGQVAATGPSTSSIGPNFNSDPFTAAGYPYTYELLLYLNDGTQNVDTWRIVIECTDVDTGTISYSRVTQSGTSSPSGDPDGDGISGSRDNCPYDYNPAQEDGWGSMMGDLCDTEWYNLTGQGVAGFVQKNGMFHLHSNCIYLDDGTPRCPVIAAFDPTTFNPAQMPMSIGSDNAGTWSVWLHYLHNNNGMDVYQVNVYSTNPPQPDSLVDDRLEIHVTGNSWQWHQRGGDTDYHGN